MQNTITKGPDGREYVVQQEMWFHPSTPDRVMLLLCQSIANRTRYKITYGDIATGKEWGDVETGHVGRSTGTVKIPLLIKTSRSMGGGALLSHCIVKIEHANKRDGRVPLWDVSGRGMSK